jgi:hypothetical protein
MRFSRWFRFIAPMVMCGSLVLPPTLLAQGSAPSPQGPTYQWVLSGPFYRCDFVTCCTRDCRGSRIGHRKAYIPFYVYVLTQVEEERGTTIPQAPAAVPTHEAPFVGDPGTHHLPVPRQGDVFTHEAPFVGNPGPGSVR